MLWTDFPPGSIFEPISDRVSPLHQLQGLTVTSKSSPFHQGHNLLQGQRQQARSVPAAVGFGHISTTRRTAENVFSPLKVFDPTRDSVLTNNGSNACTLHSHQLLSTSAGQK